jgi:hypothetical protein
MTDKDTVFYLKIILLYATKPRLWHTQKSLEGAFMKRLMMICVIVGALAPSFARAQVDIDMGRVTCAEFLAMPEGRGDVFAAWISGWVHQKVGRTQIDLVAFKKNIANVKSWCGYHKDESVMRGLYDALGVKN